MILHSENNYTLTTSFKRHIAYFYMLSNSLRLLIQSFFNKESELFLHHLDLCNQTTAAEWGLLSICLHFRGKYLPKNIKYY